MAGPTDWGAVYRANVDAVCALVGSLDETQLAQIVPATPAWTVHDVLAHLAGGPADVLADRMDGAPSPDWTARHVAERTDRTTDELVAELQGSVDPLVGTFEGTDSPAIVWNAAVHHADLHEALGKHVPPEEMWRPILDVLGPRLLGDHADAVRGVSDYELFRGYFSRRSRSQMAAWGTSLDAEALDALCIFGPREDDQPE